MYDIIVVGGGHAGIEAALAPARMNQKTVLVTSNFDNVGSLPCNTSIGGPAKGIIVREIDALGGQMPKTADKTYLQMKMLNTAKGPGVQSLRAQADKKVYPRYMQEVLIDPATGKEIFLTKDGKPTFQHSYDNEVVVGNTNPDVEGVWSNSLYWKGFSLNLHIRYSLGGQRFNSTLYEKVENISVAGLSQNQDRRALYDRCRDDPGEESRWRNMRS